MERNEEKSKQEGFSVYCNNVDVTMSPFDFTFNLGKNSPREEKHLGEIHMSPEHAKAFMNIIVNNVQHYEKMFGNIPQMDEERMKQLENDPNVEVRKRV